MRSNQNRYLLIWCEQVTDALGQLQTGEFDVVLLDCPTPEQPTRDIIPTARGYGITLPIIAMTCDDQQAISGEMTAALGQGVDYLAKVDLKPYLLDRYLRDALAREALQRKLREHHRFDPLTGLPNRLEFRRQLGRALDTAATSEKRLALLLINIDGFKRFNESFGHDAGDQLVATIASRINHSVRKSDQVARIGGDEFALILENCRQREDIQGVAEKSRGRADIAN